MKFHIITIFPEAYESFLTTSIIGKAIEKGLLQVELYKLNKFAKDSSGHVDDKAYGMHGQVLSAIPLSRAIEHIFERVGKLPVIYMDPKGQLLEQSFCEELSQNLQECIIVCGHYEGIDERIIDLYVDYSISIGEYILTGGEIASQVLIDSLVRLRPGVLGSEISHSEESFSKSLGRQKEYPVYTRPRNFKGLEVPEILTSGNHKEIEKWKQSKLQK